MAKILTGKEVSDSIIRDCAESVSEKITRGSLAPKLVIVNIGNDDSNDSYIKGITKKAAEAGVLLEIQNYDLDVSKNHLIEQIHNLNDNDEVNGILLMRPFPENIRNIEHEVCEEISQKKDVDAAKDLSVAGSFLNNKSYGPCTAESCIKILDYYDCQISGKHVVVIGRSMVVGKPLANMLLNRNATVTVCHSKTSNIKKIISSADIVIVATGNAKMFNGSYFKDNQIVIDAGINWDSENNKLCGDVDFDSAVKKVEAITPVPGGVGSVTSAVLISHVVL